MKVLILFGTSSYEYNISCLSTSSIMQHIDNTKFDITYVGISKDNKWYIFNGDYNSLLDDTWKNHSVLIKNIVKFIKKYDLVIPMIHGKYGEDGKIAGFLDLFGIKYIGSDTLTSAICMDKEITKIIVNSIGIPQVKYVSFIYPNYDVKDIERIKYPVIIKPANNGSSIGINKANNRKELIKYIKEASFYDKKIIVEKYVKCREIEVAINDSYEYIGEIDNNYKMYDYDSKYVDSFKTKIPKLDIKVRDKILKYARDIYTRLNCKDLSRIDFFLVKNKLYFNEVNTIPGFTDISMYPKLMTQDRSYSEMLEDMILNKK